MNNTANAVCRAGLERLMNEFAVASSDGAPILHQRLSGLPDQRLSKETWELFRDATTGRFDRKKKDQWEKWVPHRDGLVCSRFVGVGDEVSFELFRRLADTGMALLRTASLSPGSTWNFESRIADKIESPPTDETYLSWLDLLHLTAKQCRTLFLHVDVGNWNRKQNPYETAEQVAAAMAEPSTGDVAFPIHPILESLQHDVFRSSVEAIKVWLAAEDVVRVGDWPERPPFYVPSLNEDSSATSTGVIAPTPQATSTGVIAPTPQATSTGVIAPTPQAAVTSTPDPNKLVIDRDTFTVWYGGKPCKLGNTNPFDLIERLNRKPGAYVSVKMLIDDVWRDEETEKGTVQKTISDLRLELKKAGIAGVEIDGSQRDHYALILTAPTISD